MSEQEEKILSLEHRLRELSELVELHQHLGTDTRPIDYRYLDNKPIDIDGTLDNRLGAGGLKIGANGSLSVGQTAYNTGTGFWLERNAGTPRMSLGVAGGAGFTWDGTTFSISGTITATAGTIGGWTVGATSLTSGSGANTVGLDSGGTNPAIYAGSATPGSAPFRVTQAGALTATSATITGSVTATSGAIGGFTIGATTISATNLTFTSGAANTANITVGTGATAAGLNSANLAGDIAIWAGSAFADRATAPFRVTAAGAITATSATITGAITTGAGSSIDGTYLTAASVLSASVNLALRGWTITCAFSITDLDTVSWGAGTFTASDGTAYSIGAGNTGNMAARTYIYLDIAVSTTALQTTTTAATAVGNGKVLIGTAINGTDEAEFEIFGGIGGANINGSNIVALSITGAEVAANTITAGKLSVSQLSAIVADLGAITAGSIVLPSGGFIRSGMTAYNTGTGFYLGNDTGTPRFSIGNSADTSKLLLWDGTNLTVNDSIIAGQDIFGDGSDGVVTISIDTTLSSDMFYDSLTINTGITLNTGGYRIFVKNTLTTNGTGKIVRNGNNGGAGGNGSSWNSAGAAGAAAAALADGSIKGAPASTPGVAGVNGVRLTITGNTNGLDGTGGAAGANTNKSLVTSDGVAGVTGGAGGGTSVPFASSGGSTLAGGAAGTRTGTVYNKVKSAFAAYNLFDIYPESGGLGQVEGLKGAPNNGSSGVGSSAGIALSGSSPVEVYSGATGGSGGTGGNGGIVVIFARIIVNNGTISANGGTGGVGGNAADSFANSNANTAAGGSGGSGGGAGGGGGVVILIYSTLTNNGTIGAAGGAGGAGGAAGLKAEIAPGAATNGTIGNSGTSGNTGIVLQLRI